MNSQNITTRANAEHFGHAEVPTDARVAKKGAKPQGNRQNKKSEPAPSHHHESAVETTFRVEAPSASSVLLVGEFTEWEKSPVKMIRGGGGVWHAQTPLPSGRHQYRFIVDGQWQNDSSQTELVPNNFGSFNNVVEIS